MDDDCYESLNDQFKIIKKDQTSQNFVTSTELTGGKLVFEKVDISHDEMVGDPSRGKAIKNSRPAVYDLQTTNPVKPKPKDWRHCPICSEILVATCSCENHDSRCKNNHKWHTKNGKIILGHSH